jgi:hypothetical protein
LLQQSGTNSNISVSNCFSTNSENNQNVNLKMTNSNEDLLFKEQEKVVLIDFRENDFLLSFFFLFNKRNRKSFRYRHCCLGLVD